MRRKAKDEYIETNLRLDSEIFKKVLEYRDVNELGSIPNAIEYIINSFSIKNIEDLVKLNNPYLRVRLKYSKKLTNLKLHKDVIDKINKVEEMLKVSKTSAYNSILNYVITTKELKIITERGFKND